MWGVLGTRPHPSSYLSPAAGHPPLPLGLSSPPLSLSSDFPQYRWLSQSLGPSSDTPLSPFLCTFPERHPAMFCAWFQCDLPTSEDTVQISPVMRRLPYSSVSFLPRVYLEVPVPPAQTFSSCTTGSPRPTQMSPEDRLQVRSEDSLCHCFTDESFSL